MGLLLKERALVFGWSRCRVPFSEQLSSSLQPSVAAPERYSQRSLPRSNNDFAPGVVFRQRGLIDHHPGPDALSALDRKRAFVSATTNCL